MQVYKEKTVDARTFPQIWASLNSSERDELSYQLFRAKCTKTRQTIWNWANGKSQPNMPLIRKAVASVVGKVIGTPVLENTLFPDSLR